MNKIIKRITSLLAFSLLLTACGSSSKSNSSPSEERNNYSASDFSFSEENTESDTGTDSSAAKTSSVSTSTSAKSEPAVTSAEPTITSAEQTVTSAEKHNIVAFNPQKNKLLYLNLDQKTKLDSGYSFHYYIDNTTSDKMIFTVTSVECDNTDITELADISLIEIEGLQSTEGKLTINYPQMGENSVLSIVGNWTNESGIEIFNDFSYSFDVYLIN